MSTARPSTARPYDNELDPVETTVIMEGGAPPPRPPFKTAWTFVLAALLAGLTVSFWVAGRTAYAFVTCLLFLCTLLADGHPNALGALSCLAILMAVTNFVTSYQDMDRMVHLQLPLAPVSLAARHRQLYGLTVSRSLFQDWTWKLVKDLCRNKSTQAKALSYLGGMVLSPPTAITAVGISWKAFRYVSSLGGF
ncbi:putative transmembrane protein [Gregarina niphandrodes]|uniref:Transmembrane protein n=1 Tax=Gregarina niphandrodes TaxID=110365 RepID=A0A023B217_GRENI|nr:putative transmembrane protein [Gregarina niphandrodes]EZG50023.1 putative transmembrane protein [Gregarina niphandrodes]|eukprot:XP_011132027.1 putative transmembrane protein [Gregarina niphandrodes]